MATNHLEHQAGDDFVIIFKDCIGDVRPSKTMVKFLNQLKALSEEYDFAIDTWGNRKRIKRLLFREVLMTLADKIEEHV